MEKLEVWVVTVFESGDGTTSPWGVYTNEEAAEAHKADLMESELNKDGYYLQVDVSKHEVDQEYEEDDDDY